MERIPIFIVTCDRLVTFKKALDSYEKYIDSPWDLIIIDQGTTFPDTVNYLKELEKNGAIVYRKGFAEYIRPANFPKVEEAISEHFSKYPPSKFILTDDDWELDAEGDILEVLSYLLDKHPEVDVLGPDWIFDDVPKEYPQYNRLINHACIKGIRERSKTTTRILGKFNNKDIIGYPEWIESSFSMYDPHYKDTRNWFSVRRNGYRLLPPYSIRHLPWYDTEETKTPDILYYEKHRVQGQW